MTGEFILLSKDTSMLAAVGVMEIVMYAKTMVASTGSLTPYIVAALFYLVITIPLAKLVGNLEVKLSANDGGSSMKKAKKGKKRKVPKNCLLEPMRSQGCLKPWWRMGNRCRIRRASRPSVLPACRCTRGTVSLLSHWFRGTITAHPE